MSDDNPFENLEAAHERARKLMVNPIFWDCTNEAAPFGSDEGSDAYYEWREWREDNASGALIDCLDWICDGQLQSYTMELASPDQVAKDLVKPSRAFLVGHFDIFTLDTTIIATGLGQLIDEGTIDEEAKQYILVAIARQRSPEIGHYAQSTLDAIELVVTAA